jgi:two-component system response regulator DegU
MSTNQNNSQPGHLFDAPDNPSHLRQHQVPQLHSNHNTAIRVLIVEPQQLMREGLKRMFADVSDMTVVAECINAKQVLVVCQSCLVDVILMEQDPSGEILQKIKHTYPDIRIMIVTDSEEEAYIFEALYKGANGYFLKDASFNELVAAIRIVAQGQSYIYPRVASSMISQIRETMPFVQNLVNSNLGHLNTGLPVATAEKACNPLTRRESEVLRLIALGKTNKVIGETLFISEKTVKNHVSHIFQKLGANDRTTAVVESIKLGWVAL